MRTSKYILAAICLGLIVQTVNAMPIMEITDTVTVGDKKWAQVNLFLDVGRADIDTVCPSGSGGVCAGSLLADAGQTFNMNGWTWASRAEVGDLVFKALVPGFAGGEAYAVLPVSTGWDPLIAAGFSPTYFASTSGGGNILTEGALQGFTRDSFLRANGGASASFVEDGSDCSSDDINSCSGFFSQSILDSQTTYLAADPRIGAWFHMNAVPEPTTLALMGLGIAGLGFRRKAK